VYNHIDARSLLETALIHQRGGIITNSTSLEHAFDQYYRAIFRYLRYRGADVDTANDLTSTVFEKALANLQSYDPRKGQIQAWLFAIAHNLAINHWRAETHHPTTSLDDLDLLAQEDPPPEENIVLIQDGQEILNALKCLDDRAVEIIALKFSGSLTNREIADLTDLSESNVGVILYRSLVKLRAVLASAQTEVRHDRE